jgi:hypothetical protein
MWYCASIFFISERDANPGLGSLWEERLVLVDALDEITAKETATSLGQEFRAPYKNQEGISVSWRFVKVERLYAITDDQLKTGTELFSRFLRDTEAKSLMLPFGDKEY